MAQEKTYENHHDDGTGNSRAAHYAELQDRDDRGGPYRHGGTPGDHRWRSGYGSARGSGAQGSGAQGSGGDSWQSQGTAPRRTGPKGYTRPDTRIYEDVCERLMELSRVDLREVEVNVADGVVTLTGSVPDRRQKYIVEEIADQVFGVKDTDNQLRVVPGNAHTDWAQQAAEPGLTGQLGQAGESASQNVGKS